MPRKKVRTAEVSVYGGSARLSDEEAAEWEKLNEEIDAAAAAGNVDAAIEAALAAGYLAGSVFEREVTITKEPAWAKEQNRVAALRWKRLETARQKAALARAMYRDGSSAAEIAAALSRSPKQVSRYLSENGHD
jgi:DNA-binding NarL/FixJ family response regulator